MRAFRRASIQGLIGVFAFCVCALTARSEDLPAITPEELKMTSEPNAPGAPAIILYRQVDRNDNGPIETNAERIKILTEEGRKYADVEIRFNRGKEAVYGIEARTIRPDGSVVKFDGTIYEKPIVQASGVKLIAKTFTLPDVQVGSIIEYRYKHALQTGFVFDSHWILSQDLFTKRAKFSLDPYPGYGLRYSWPAGLPPGTDAPKNRFGRINLEAHDVPAFVAEEFMPPENEFKYRVDFIYLDSADPQPEKDPDVFWKKYGKKAYGSIMGFADEPRAMGEAVAQIVSPGDSADVKLRKIYERTQRIRNTSFERQKSQQEADREKLKAVKNVADIWALGYGDANQIPWLFLALVRAAGIQADPVIVPTRDTHYFDRRIMNGSDLNSNLVAVTLEGKNLYLDPGMALAPFGVLPWSETAVPGLRLDKDGGSWIETPFPEAADSRVERRAILKLTPFGDLEGQVIVTYTGQQALWRRNEEHVEDEADRKQFLEDELAASIPSGSTVELTNLPDWDGATTSLVAEYTLKVPGWAAIAGQRALLPVGLFGAGDKRIFLRAARVHPLYFRFRSQTIDDATIELPVNWQLNRAPQFRKDNRGIAVYSMLSEVKNGSLHLRRELALNMLLVNMNYYGSLQDFYQNVRAGDEEQAILVTAKAAAGG